MAAFSVWARSWNRYKGQMSSVPPARSMRVGAELLICFMSRRTQKQNRHPNGVSYLVDRRAVDDIGEESMAVCRHGDQIDPFLSRNFDDLRRGISHRQPRGHLKTRFLQLV